MLKVAIKFNGSSINALSPAVDVQILKLDSRM